MSIIKIKPLETLTIVDDFMFGAVMSYPRYCKPLLEMILHVKIRKIVYPELQKSIDKRYSSKSIRLDVYVEDEAGTVYNIEIQTTANKNLPKRTRYYQDMIDIHILDKGEDYTALRKSIVIFFCTFDPFGEGRYVYHFENRCLENHALALGDETSKIFLNTKGSKGRISRDLKNLLQYLDTLVPNNEYTRELDHAVEEVRADTKWRVEYMRLNELMMENRRLGQRLGENKRSVTQIRDFRNKFQPETLATIAYVTPELLQVILNTIDAHPDWDDETVAEHVDFNM